MFNPEPGTSIYLCNPQDNVGSCGAHLPEEPETLSQTLIKTSSLDVTELGVKASPVQL